MHTSNKLNLPISFWRISFIYTITEEYPKYICLEEIGKEEILLQWSQKIFIFQRCVTSPASSFSRFPVNYFITQKHTYWISQCLFYNHQSVFPFRKELIIVQKWDGSKRWMTQDPWNWFSLGQALANPDKTILCRATELKCVGLCKSVQNETQLCRAFDSARRQQATGWEERS